MKIDRQEIKKALATGDDTAITLIAMLSKWYAPDEKNDDDRFDFAAADPLTLLHELSNDFGGVSNRAFTKINAALSLAQNPDLFLNSVGYFMTIVSGLNGQVSATHDGAHALAKPDSDDILWAVMESMLLLGDNYSDKFKPDLRHIVGDILAGDGYRIPPEMLQWADYGKQDTERARNRATLDPAFSAAVVKQAQENKKALEIWLALQLSTMMERWLELELAHEGDEWFDAIVSAVHTKLDDINAESDKEGLEL